VLGLQVRWIITKAPVREKCPGEEKYRFPSRDTGCVMCGGGRTSAGKNKTQRYKLGNFHKSKPLKLLGR